jgi:hypothetical protein
MLRTDRATSSVAVHVGLWRHPLLQRGLTHVPRCECAVQRCSRWPLATRCCRRAGRRLGRRSREHVPAGCTAPAGIGPGVLYSQRLRTVPRTAVAVLPANFPRPLLIVPVRRRRRNAVTRAFCPPLFEGDRHGRPYKADVGGSSPSAPTPFALVLGRRAVAGGGATSENPWRTRGRPAGRSGPRRHELARRCPRRTHRDGTALPTRGPRRGALGDRDRRPRRRASRRCSPCSQRCGGHRLAWVAARTSATAPTGCRLWPACI